MKKINLMALWALLLIALPTQAVRHYKCDFETEAARNRWVMNPTANATIDGQLKNRWYLGEPGNNDKNGHYGLYISDDNGQKAHYTDQASCWNFAYDTVRLDHLDEGDYTIYFDWCAMGNLSSNFDGLYLLWIPMTKPNGDSIKVRSITSSSGTIPSAYDNYVIRLQPTANIDYLGGTSTWRQCSAVIPNDECDGTPHYLAFVWTNGSRPAQQPPAMVDNINITDNKPCDAPTNLKVTPNGSTVQLEWVGTTAEYEVSAYSYETGTWSGPKIVSGNATSFTGLPMGQTDFIVRSKCDVDYFSLKTIKSELIYYPDQLCVDYLNLDSAVCYVAKTQPTDTRNFHDWKKVNPVDYGPADVHSRHTVHFDRNELEPRTMNRAKTVPDGELASIRLGNWENQTGEGAEQIEFSFPIDTIKYPVLLLKYMPIIEAPNHDDYENSRFTLDILVDGQTIGRCGQADFNANDAYDRSTQQLKPGAAAQGWHLVPPGSFEGSTTPVVWKEWTTVGVNIKQYAGSGKTITARLATYDCIYNAHFGYAYFTLGCSDGKLQGMKCGKINPEFVAPDGFDYRWAYAYNEKYRNPDGSMPEQYILGTSQTYNAGYQDDSLYVVDCMFVQDHSCFFSLYASTLATNPISVINQPVVRRNCTSGVYNVTLDGSDSWVQEIDHVTGDTLKNKNYHIETYEWNVEGLPYGWSDEATHTFDLPAEGGIFPYSLRTTCGTCEMIAYDTLYLEPLGPTHETRTITLCDDARKTGYQWNEKPDTLYKDYGLVDSVVLFNEITTCDSIIYLQLTEPFRIYADTMLLPESLPFTFHGRTYPEGTKSLIDTIPQSETDCDTTWILNLEIYESLIAEMPQPAYVLCEGDDSLFLAFDIHRGRSLRWRCLFESPLLPDTLKEGQLKKGSYTIGIPVEGLYPNVYSGQLVLVDSMPEFNVTLPFTMTMQYASAVIAQRWNDVLAIRNAEFNGGYQFDSVQWYVNGQPIVGATDFNYYAGEGNQLRMGEEYSALLMRRDDGVKLFTCVYIPQPVPAEVLDMPTLVPLNAPMNVPGQGVAYWYDMLGRRHQTEAYHDSDITAPGSRGYYLLVLQGDDSRTVHRVMVR